MALPRLVISRFAVRFVLSGLALASGAASGLCADGPAEGPQLERPDAVAPPATEELPAIPGPGIKSRVRALQGLQDAVNAELFDVAGALRSLDQSYSRRGIVGCGAATGGSAWFDWHAHGLCRPEGYVRTLPPPPRVLGGCQALGACQCPADDFCEMLAWWHAAQRGELPLSYYGSGRCGRACGARILSPEAAPAPATSSAAGPTEIVQAANATAVDPLDLFTFTPGVPVVWRLETVGGAVIADSWLDCSRGHVRVHGVDELVAKSARDAGAWTIEAVVDHRAPSEGFAPLVTSGTRRAEANFSLGIEGDQVVLHVTTDAASVDQLQWRAGLAKLKPGRQHVLVSYRSGEVVCAVNGEVAARLTNINGSLANWAAAPLTLGSAETASRWSGRIAGVGLFPRFIGEAGARQRYEFAAGMLAAGAR